MVTIQANIEKSIFLTFYFENAPIDLKSKGSVPDLFPTLVPSTNILCRVMFSACHWHCVSLSLSAWSLVVMFFSTTVMKCLKAFISFTSYHF